MGTILWCLKGGVALLGDDAVVEKNPDRLWEPPRPRQSITVELSYNGDPGCLRPRWREQPDGAKMKTEIQEGFLLPARPVHKPRILFPAENDSAQRPRRRREKIQTRHFHLVPLLAGSSVLAVSLYGLQERRLKNQ
jgi:hypothetical protein